MGGLNEIVSEWSASLHLVLAARSDPLLPLHRYRVAGQLAELRAADMVASTRVGRRNRYQINRRRRMPWTEAPVGKLLDALDD